MPYLAALLGWLLLFIIGCSVPVTARDGDGAAEPAGTGRTRPRAELVVFAAASLTEPFNELAQGFSGTQGGAGVAYNFGGSNQLRAQMEQGAHADVFASANELEMEKLRAAGLVAGTPAVFADNRLVIVTPKANPGRIERLQDIGRPGLKLVVAGPTVPAGAYTVQMLDNLSADPAFGPRFRDQVVGNVISQEINVKQVVAKVQLGEADAGIVYTSDVSAQVAGDVHVVDVPEPFNVRVTYPIAVTATAREPELARAFVDYVLSPEGQQVLGKYQLGTVR